MTGWTGSFDRRVAARLGAWTGIAMFAGILAFVVVGPQVVAGERVSGVVDEAAIRAYYDHPALLWLATASFLVPPLMLLFFLSLREVVGTTPGRRFLATFGVLAAAVEAPLLLGQSALSAALVEQATTGGEVLPLFRTWDYLYNSGADAVEIGWVLAFSLAARGIAGFPRWFAVHGAVAAALLLVIVFLLPARVPDQVHLLLYLPVIAWLLVAIVSLFRHARTPAGDGRVPATPG